ncbi:MAG: SdrD B-like domain-containing protein, partial [Actinomycetota bacterium]
MRRLEHHGARVMTAFGLGAGAVYLVDRLVGSMHGVSAWLAMPAYLVEMVGFLGSFALAWALWPLLDRRHDAAPSPRRSGRTGARVDAVVRVADQPEHEVRATLLALRSVRGVSDIVIIDIGARPSVAALATEFQAVYAATDPDDRNGLHVMVAAVRTPEFLLLDAGDIPSADIVEALVPVLLDPRVAVVQGLGVSVHDDSPEHGPGRRHDLVFERSSLNPALGRRDTAMWLGSGSLVRADAVRRVRRSTERPLTAHWLAGAEMLSAGWRIAAPSGSALVAHRAITSDHEAYDDRVERARAARRLLLGRRGALRARSLGVGQRFAMFAWAVRPLSGLRRVVFLGVLCSALLVGEAPFRASAWLLALWLGSFVYTSLGIGLLSGWTLQPGDRTRWSLQMIGPAYSSLRRARTAARRHRLVSHPAAQYGAGLVASVVVLSVVIVLRGLSDRVTHMLGAMPLNELMALLAVALWVLGLSLELLRVLAGRGVVRRSPRIAASLPSRVADRASTIIDITPIGAGLLGRTALDVGSQVLLESMVPTASGETVLYLPVVVRNVRVMPNGDFRVGVEFVGVDDAVANALAEFCIVEPMWERMGVMPDRSVLDARPTVYVEDEPSPRAGRSVVRVVSLLALVGAIASAMPITADASPSLQHLLNGVVVSRSLGEQLGVAGAVITAVCSDEAGADLTWGTADDTYRAPVSAVSNAAGSYQLALHGVACWSQVAPPAGYTTDNAGVGGVSRLTSIDVSSPAVIDRTVLGSLSPLAPNGTGSIGDQVWNDINRNGIHELIEPGLSGVELTLYDVSNRVLARMVSGPNGTYRFGDLPLGTYRVGASNLPAQMSFTIAGNGRDTPVDSDVDAVTGQTVLVRLADGQHLSTLDIGLVDDVAPATLHRTTTVRVLPAPATGQLALVRHRQSMLALLVVGIASLLAGSVLLGLTWPQRRTL